MKDLDFNPENQWSWTLIGFLFGAISVNVLIQSLDLSGNVVTTMFAAGLGGILGWVFRFYEANYS